MLNRLNALGELVEKNLHILLIAEYSKFDELAKAIVKMKCINLSISIKEQAYMGCVDEFGRICL